MVNPASPDATEVLRQFRVIFGAVRHHFQVIEKACGISGAQVWAMAALRESPGMKVSDLARALSIHTSTASNLLDKVEKAGLVRRERNSPDQRVVRLYLTDAGERALTQAPQPLTSLLPHALNQLPAKSLKRLNEDLAAVISHLGAVDARDAQKLLSDL